MFSNILILIRGKLKAHRLNSIPFIDIFSPLLFQRLKVVFFRKLLLKKILKGKSKKVLHFIFHVKSIRNLFSKLLFAVSTSTNQCQYSFLTAFATSGFTYFRPCLVVAQPVTDFEF